MKWQNWGYKMEFKHYSVLLSECIEALNIRPDGIYVDATAGGAGHSVEIVKKISGTGRLIAIDKDPTALKIAGERLAGYSCAQVVRGDFRNIDSILQSLEIDKVDGILADIGVSSHQLDTTDRGFSYNTDAFLDMRMSGEGLSAYDVVNTYSAEELRRIIRSYSEEKFASQIARNITKMRETAPIKTTFELVEIIKSSIPAAARREGGHPAKRTFQAIRIEVNGELTALEDFVDRSLSMLGVGGRLAVISFHSLEDRIVKQKFAEQSTGCICPKDFPICVCGNTPKIKLISKKPILPSQKELEENNRSHSAKLRVCEKL